MSNIKLKDHYWEASGVFDKVQNKTQRELNEVITAALDGKAPVITDTASGAVASFPDGADGLPLHNLTVQIEPVQAAGTPTPESPLPISGWTGANVTRTGKNLLVMGVSQPCTSSNGKITATPNNDGTLTVVVNENITATTIYIPNTAMPDGGKAAQKDGVKHLMNGTYKVIFDDTNGQQRLYLQVCGTNNPSGISDINVIYTGHNGTFTIDDTYAYNYIMLAGVNGLPAGTYILKAMIVLSDETDTTYEPYRGNTYNITFPSEAGTVYGGTLNATTGALTVTRYIVQLPDALSALSTGTYYFLPHSSQGSDFKKAIGKANVICNMLKTDPNRINLSVSGSGSTNAIYCRDDSCENAESFKSKYSSAMFVYELNTPMTYHLTPQEVTTLFGINNIWADCGDVSVEYRADTKLYIDKKLAALVAALS